MLFCIISTYCFHEYLNYSIIWQQFLPCLVLCYYRVLLCFVCCHRSPYVPHVNSIKLCFLVSRYPTICCSKLLKVTQLTQLHILLTGLSVPTREWRRGTSLQFGSIGIGVDCAHYACLSECVRCRFFCFQLNTLTGSTCQTVDSAYGQHPDKTCIVSATTHTTRHMHYN